MNNSLDQIRLHDLKIEVLIAELLEFYENEILPINLSLQGQFDRAYSKEVLGHVLKFDSLGDEYEELKICREGVYDGLPHFSSHTITGKQKKDNQQEKKSTLTQELDEEEACSRLFFNPFEQEIYRYRGQVLKDEMDFKVSLDVFKDHFYDMVDKSSEFNLDVLVPILPLVYSLKGDVNNFIKLMRELLRIEATIKYVPVSEISLKYKDEVPLGELSLGQNSVVDSTSLDFATGVSIEINQSDMSFDASEKMKKMVRFLADIALPADLTYDVNVSISESLFILSDNTDKCSILAFNTII